MAKYKLKEGVVLRPYGESSLIDNDNLTDELAVYFLETGKAQKEDFEDFEDSKKEKAKKAKAQVMTLIGTVDGVADTDSTDDKTKKEADAIAAEALKNEPKK